MPYLDSANYDLPYASESETSRDAAVQARKFVGRQGLTVLAWFVSRGAYGGTQREASAALVIGRPSIAARVHALEATKRLVKVAGVRRGGYQVYRTC